MAHLPHEDWTRNGDSIGFSFCPTKRGDVRIQLDDLRYLLREAGYWPMSEEAPDVDQPVHPPLPDPEPGDRERYVKVDGHVQTVVVMTDEKYDPETDSAPMPTVLARELLMAAGYRRDYVRDDVELDRLRRAGASIKDFSVAATEVANAEPEPLTWDTVPVDWIRGASNEDAGKLGRPATSRGVLAERLYGLAWRQRVAVDWSQYNDLTEPILETVGAIVVLDNANDRG